MKLSEIQLRPAQAEIMRYEGGYMGVSAVPGAGKTWILSLLAAEIVASGQLEDEQEVLVVTLVNSAVDNFYNRVSSFIQQAGLLPHMGYRVRTLHGLAHDIARERPGLVRLDDQFEIVDEREATSILSDATRAWLRVNGTVLEPFLDQNMDEGKQAWLFRDKLPEQVGEIAVALIRTAKDLRLTPEQLRLRLDDLQIPLPLAQMGAQIYTDYQRALEYRGAVDFDDLIRLAIQALEADPEYLARLRNRWPFILEDEAQDSSRLQEQILASLAGPNGNWVRLGDPNQAIYETFTTASPRHLAEFLSRTEVEKHDLPNSGRSTRSIIDLANYLVEWTINNHPTQTARSALIAPPFIQPTPPGDPQPNPDDDPDQIYLFQPSLTAEKELQVIAGSLARWLPAHPDSTVAVLAPRNKRLFELASMLEQRGIPCEQGLLRSSTTTRASAKTLVDLLRYLADPGSSRKLSVVYQAWSSRKAPDEGALQQKTAELIRKQVRTEDYLWPVPGRDWLGSLRSEKRGLEEKINPQVLEELEAFRLMARRWQGSILLPIDQLVLTLAQDLLTDPGELAVAHKLAVLLRQASQNHPDWRLPRLSEQLDELALKGQRFLGFSETDTGFNPEQYRGKVVLATIHKAKGLEWDRVYLMSVNNYDFPSDQPGDDFISERWFVRDHLNLQAEALAQLQAAFEVKEFSWYEEGQASAESRLEYVRERLRLLYVGITRAKRELVITWNTGQRGKCLPAMPLTELWDFWEKQHPLFQEEGSA
jgi:DNA helicase-2/ATP-dependent DNA helicase PcrA